ncbi:hypothetical protein [Erwinia sp. 9145]|uniref:hypothetical protein n=1 Tax=Erwinia sp. 9145 TaxID=1500895 RepID=UPI0018CD731A|nr:hypothetical protein [Erwinia sp. 9145]
MLIGYVLLIISLPQYAPVSETIYPTRAVCEQMKARILDRRPNVALECGEVWQ